MNGSTRRASVLAFVAVSGVTVFATVERQASMTVEPRNWTGLVTYPAALPATRIDVHIEHGTRSPYWIALPNGLDSFPAGWAGAYSYGYERRGRMAVGSGINSFWSYYRSPPQFLTPEVWISRALYSGNPYYDAQDINVSRQRPPNPQLSRYCTREDVDALLGEVLRHEGAAIGPRKSHHATFVSYFAAHDPSLVFERTAFAAPETVSDTTYDALRAAATEAAGYADAIRNDSIVVHAQANLIPKPTCKLRMPQ